MEQNNGDFGAEECRAVMKYLLLKGNTPKNITMIFRLLGDRHPSYCTVKSWVAGFRTEHWSTEDISL
jgi:hypothetical protein